MIQIFTTGGTIEGLDYVNDNDITESKITIKDFLNNANVHFEYSIENVFRKDSRTIVENAPEDIRNDLPPVRRQNF
jgi:L-asparaginase